MRARLCGLFKNSKNVTLQSTRDRYMDVCSDPMGVI